MLSGRVRCLSAWCILSPDSKDGPLRLHCEEDVPFIRFMFWLSVRDFLLTHSLVGGFDVCVND